MEQIQELLEILKSTPEMALWGLTIWCLYILAKLASVVFAAKIVTQLAINKWHDFSIKKLETQKVHNELALSKEKLALKNETSMYEKARSEFKDMKREYKKDNAQLDRLAKLFKKQSISNVELDRLKDLLSAVKKGGAYIHESSIEEAIEKLRND